MYIYSLLKSCTVQCSIHQHQALATSWLDLAPPIVSKLLFGTRFVTNADSGHLGLGFRDVYLGI